MKNLLIGLSLLTSMSSFATSEFERGYKSGVETCSSEKLVSCKVEFQVSIHPSHPLEFIEKISEGYTRGEALRNLIKVCEKSVYKYRCLEAVRSGLSVCKNL